LIVAPLGDFQGVKSGFQLIAVSSEVLQQLDLLIEMNHEGHVLIVKHLVEKNEAGVALIFQHAPLAVAGIHQQSQRERQVRVLIEVMDGLGAAIFFQDEIILAEIADNLFVLVTHRRRHFDHPHVRCEGRVLALRLLAWRLLTLRFLALRKPAWDKQQDCHKPS
jgi:hypothetical protein